MKNAQVLLPLVAALGLASPAWAGPHLTIYSRDLGFVRETRDLETSSSPDTVRLTDVSEQLDFASLRLAPAAASTRVTRLAYRFDVASGDGLVDHARGSRVRVTTRGDRLTEGTLVSADGNWLVVRGDDGALNTLSRSAVETIRLSSPPAALSLRPTVEAVVEGARGRSPAELSYLTGGLSWSAEHVLVRKGENAGTWSSRVTIENSTGRDFHDAAVKLVAGEPQRDNGPTPMPMAPRMALMSAASAEAKADMSQQDFADYHLYTLERPATLRDRESQSLSMLEPRAVKVTPLYLVRPDGRGVRTQVEMKNDAASGLGEPLPAGRVRVFETDAAGDLQFTGETRIGHTAQGEKLTLDVGQAFDLVAERREVSDKRLSDREREYQIEIKLRNQKKNQVSIVVEEPVSGDVEITQKTHPFERKDANTLRWTIAVPAGKEVLLSYTAHVRY